MSHERFAPPSAFSSLTSTQETSFAETEAQSATRSAQVAANSSIVGLAEHPLAKTAVRVTSAVIEADLIIRSGTTGMIVRQ